MFMESLASNGTTLVMTDISENMIKLAEERFQESRFKNNFRVNYEKAEKLMKVENERWKMTECKKEKLVIA
jgi:ubiquinone/menaquinone biosynthesis C-methylase UbiE